MPHAESGPPGTRRPAIRAILYALGRVLPGRFTAPLVAIGMLGLLSLGVQVALGGSLLGHLSPAFRMVDTAAAEFPAKSPYYYISRGETALKILDRPDVGQIQVIENLGRAPSAFGMAAQVLQSHAVNGACESSLQFGQLRIHS